MARKEILSKDRFDTRAIYNNVGMQEKEYNAVKDTEKQTGQIEDYVRVTFAQRLTDQLQNRLLTDVAERINIAQGSFSDYRSGKAEPRISALAKIAGYFQVSSDYLLGLTETKTVIPDKKKACEYTGLSDEAVDVLQKGFVDRNRPLYSQIMSYLLSKGIFDNLVKQLENSLIQQEQYNVLFGESEQQQSVLETQEYFFNKQLSELYRNVMTDMGKELSSKIECIANQRFFDLVDSAMDTKYKMEQIIEEALSDPQILAEYNKRGLTDIS